MQGSCSRPLRKRTSRNCSLRAGSRRFQSRKARDGVTDIYGLLYKPTQLDPTKKYPIVNNIYPGPQGAVSGFGVLPRHEAIRKLSPNWDSWSFRLKGWGIRCDRRNSTIFTTGIWETTRCPTRLQG